MLLLSIYVLYSNANYIYLALSIVETNLQTMYARPTRKSGDFMVFESQYGRVGAVFTVR